MQNIVTYDIYTDGSSSKTGSGFGFIVVESNSKEIISMVSQKLPSTATNQQAELLAAIFGHKWIKNNIQNYFQVNIYSDSAYLVNCKEECWYKNWIYNGWTNSKGKNVANQPLWEELIPLFDNQAIEFIKVKGHNGNLYNEMADALATQSFDKLKKLWYNYLEKKRKGNLIDGKRKYYSNSNS